MGSKLFKTRSSRQPHHKQHRQITDRAPDTRARTQRSSTQGGLSPSQASALLVWYGDVALLDLVDDVVRVLALDGASNRLRRAQHLEHGALEFLRQRARPHGARDLVNLLEGDVARVRDCGTKARAEWRVRGGEAGGGRGPRANACASGGGRSSRGRGQAAGRVGCTAAERSSG